MKFSVKHALEIKLGPEDKRVDIREVESAMIPERTETWTPTPHGFFIELVVDKIFDRGLAISETCHLMSHGGLRYVGILDVRSRNYATDHSWVVAAINSNDKSLSASILSGCRIFASNAIAFSAEIALSRRHTKDVRRDLPMIVDKAIEELYSQWNIQDKRLECYRECNIDDKQMHHLVMSAFEGGILSTRDLQRVVKFWRKPKDERFRSRTAWTLYNACLASLKELTVRPLMASTTKLTALFDRLCEFRCIAENIVQPELI